MKKHIRISAFLTLSVIMFQIFSAFAYAKSDYTEYMEAPKYADKVMAYYLYNIDSDTVVAEKNQDVKLNPSSLPKIMAGLLFCEIFSERLEEEVTVTRDMVSQFYGKNMKLTEGETVKVIHLIHAAICGTYNDAALVLAFTAAGGTAQFVALMNERAAKIGMKNTVFSDLTGIHNGKDTTAEDLAVLCKEAYQNNMLMSISSEYKYEIPATNKSDARPINNSNWLINDSSGRYYSNTYCCGLNSGNTTEGGWCLATIADFDDTHYICIVLGGESDEKNYYSYLVANQLISLAQTAFTVCDVTDRISISESVPISGTGHRNSTVGIVAEGKITAFIPKDSVKSDKITYEERFESSHFTAPVKEGDVAGVLVIKFDGEEIGRTKLLFTESVERNKILIFIDKLESFFKSRFFIAFAITAALLTVIYVAVFCKKATTAKSVRVKKQKIHKFK